MSSYVWIVEENRKAGFPGEAWVPARQESAAFAIPIIHPSRQGARRAARAMRKREDWPMKVPYIVCKYRVAKYIREET